MGLRFNIAKILPWHKSAKKKDNLPFVMSKRELRKAKLKNEHSIYLEKESIKAEMNDKAMNDYIEKQRLKWELRHNSYKSPFAPN